MRFLSPLLKHAIYPALHHSGLLNRMMPLSGYSVVNYHGVIPSSYSSSDDFIDGNLVPPEVFRQQLQFLKAHYHVIHPEDFRAWIERGTQLPPRSVLLTCDDGLVNTLTDMLPVLQSESIPCLFFVTAASCSDTPGMLWYDELYLLMRLRPPDAPDLLPSELGAPSSSADSFQSRWWSTVRRASRLDAKTRAEWMDLVRSDLVRMDLLRSQSSPAPDFLSGRRWRLLNISELRQLAGAGMIIGAHTRSHPVLSLCSEDEARREIQQSKSELEAALRLPVWAFAYPFGNPSTISERELRLAQDAAFTCAFLNVERWGLNRSNPFALSRVHVTSNMTLPEFAAHLSGFHARLQSAAGS
jgi:peptidoglycan/xylan/chitin deacetylase (PgdA/CDA1 family)